MLKKMLNIFKSPQQANQVRETESLQSLELRRLELEKIYNHVGEFDLDSKIAWVLDENEYKKGYIKSNGELLMPLGKYNVTDFSEGKGIIQIQVKEFNDEIDEPEDCYEIKVLDKDGNCIKKFTDLYYLWKFKNNQAIAQKSNMLYGKINNLWETIIPFKYKYIEELNDEMVLANYEDFWCVINNKNEYVVSPIFNIIIYVNFEKLQIIGFKDKVYGIFDFKGNKIKDLGDDIRFHNVYSDEGTYCQKEGLLIIRESQFNCKHFSIVDTDFNTIVPFEDYIDISYINEGMIKVSGEPQIIQFSETYSYTKYTKCGFLNLKGEMVIPMKFDYADYFKEGVCAVGINKKFGYINKKGDFVIKPVFDFCSRFNNGYAKAFINKEIFIIDKSGRKVMKWRDYDYVNY